MAIDMQKRSSIRNLCPWTVSFTLPISGANISLGGNKKTSINNEELVALIENGNVMFSGTGNGDHARIYVENPELRQYVGYDSEDGKVTQFVLTDAECKKLIEYKTLNTLTKHLQTKVVANHEKAKIMDYARKEKLNDYNKIVELEKHTSIKFKQD